MSDNSNNNTPQLPPAGWYADPQDSTAQRYWDGARWTDHTAVPAAGAAEAVTPAAMTPVLRTSAEQASVPPTSALADGSASGVATVTAKRGFPRLTWWQWALVALAALVLISIIVGGVTGGRASSDAEPAQPSAGSGGFTQESRRPTEKPVETVEVPDLVGSTVAEARAKLEAVGLVLAASEAGDDWIITAQQPSQGSYPAEGLELTVTSEAPKPVYSLAQQNAIDKAQSYLNLTGFSRTGLIEQLEFEGFSTDEATFGADNAGADWNAEAAEKAKSYLELTSFSRQGLYDQLAFEGFTDAEIQFGLAAVGY